MGWDGDEGIGRRGRHLLRVRVRVGHLSTGGRFPPQKANVRTPGSINQPTLAAFMAQPPEGSTKAGEELATQAATMGSQSGEETY